MGYECVIGLEIHAQLLTESKLFCGCSTRFGASPNSQTCPVCLGLPGVLPVLNKKAVEYALKTALALHSEILPLNQFARKNYFYPDLPKAYQISQYELPIAKGGFLDFEIEGKGRKRVGLTRIHMEEDAGKLIHVGFSDGFAKKGVETFSVVDFNRTGVPLLEIVTEPEINSPIEAREFMQNLRAILQYLKVCDGNMEEGSLRCDANVSVRRVGEKALGVKTEIKNMNSFKNVQQALEYEIERQIMKLKRGEKIVQQTRLFDPDKGITHPMRSKEEAHDYRYFPEPDLLPVFIDEAWKSDIAKGLPEMPAAKKERFIAEYTLPSYDAEVLTSSLPLAEYFEECCTYINSPKLVSNWIMVELLRELNRDNLGIEDSPLSAEDFVDLLKMLESEIINGKIAKSVFSKMYKTGRRAQDIIKEENLTQITDESELERTIEMIIKDNPGPVQDFKKGKTQALGFLVGQVMKISKGKANPKMVNEILLKYLESE